MPTLLQINWTGQALHVWAIAPAQPGLAEAPAAPAEVVRALLGEACEDSLLVMAARQGELRLALPADGAAPPRCVPSLVFDAAEALDLLTCLVRPLPASCGASVEYWALLAQFICDSIARQQFVPRVDDLAGDLVASWRLLIADRAQLAWLERTALAMPPVCHAMRDPAGPPLAPEPATLVESFLAHGADALIRRALAQDPFFQGVHERAAEAAAASEVRWLSALLGADRILPIGNYEQRAAFLQQAQAWLGQLDDSNPALLRLAMVLHEPPPSLSQSGLSAPTDGTPADGMTTDGAPPEEPEPVWTLTLHLQGIDGEGELIDAESLWNQGSQHSPILGRSVARRQAALLAEIARAAEVFPPMVALLSHPAPSQVQFTTLEAHAFIRHWGPILRDRGFGITLPEWSQLPDEEIGLRLDLDPIEGLEDMLDLDGVEGGSGRRPPRAPGEALGFETSTGHFGLDSLMNFNWRIAVGTARLTPEEFEGLVARSAPLVRFRNRWVQIDLDAARKAIEFLKQRPSGQITLGDAFRTAFTASRARTGLNVVGLGGSSWFGKLLEQAPVDELQRWPQPAGFKGELRPYQLRGLHWLAFLDRLGLGAVLADDMGLGKTIQFIALLLHERERAALRTPPVRVGPTLLFVPTSVVGNWLREAQRFAPQLKVMVHHGPERLTGETFERETSDCDLVITSYSLAHRDQDELAKIKWHRIALDEAQKIKNPSAAATLAVRSLAAPHRVALTGTPIENHLSELWSIMEVLNPGLLGTAADFREKFAVPIEKLNERERADQLRRMIRPFILRRTKADPTIAGDLPEKLEMKVFCNLTTEQAALYERFVNDSLGRIDSASGIRRRGLILATLTRLKQICDHPALLETDATSLDHRSGKCERLVDMLEELLDEGDAALVFTQFREMGHLLERVIHQRLGKPTLFLHGGTPARMRDQMILNFQAREPASPRIFLLSLRAGGLGLNLTAANHVFHYDRWWNPAVEQQATDRAHRVGQTRTVQVHKFVCIGTMEERIDKLLTEKQALADQIVGTGDDWLTNLSTDQLRQCLSLSREAVGDE